MYYAVEAGTHCMPNAPHTGTLALQRNLLAWTPGATNLGCYNCRPQNNGSGNLSVHAVWRACDTGCPSFTKETPQGVRLSQLLIAVAPLIEVQRFIHAKQIWDPWKGFHPYTGPDAHFNHVHSELTPRGAAMSDAEVDAAFHKILTGVGNGTVTPAPVPTPKPPRRQESQMVIINVTDVPGGTVKGQYLCDGIYYKNGTTEAIAALQKAGIPSAFMTLATVKETFIQAPRQ